MSEEKVQYNIDNEKSLQHKLASMFAANKDEVSVPKIYIDMTGEWETGAIIDEIMFWTLPKKSTGKTSLRVFRDNKLWLAVRRSDWWERKRIKERQADLAIKKLKEQGLIESDVFLFDGKPTVHLRLNLNKFVILYTEKLQNYAQEDGDENLISDIADLYEMMGFPNQTVKSILPNGEAILQNGEMLNLPNGEIINSPIQPENTTKSQLPENSDLAFLIASNQPIDEKEQKKRKTEHDALIAFEASFGVNVEKGQMLGWYGRKPEWTRLRKDVTELYQADPQCFEKYKVWRLTPYSKGTVSLKDVQRDPACFMTSWVAFVEATSYGDSKIDTPTVVNDGDVTITY